jgi:hypothetical protein
MGVKKTHTAHDDKMADYPNSNILCSCFMAEVAAQPPLVAFIESLQHSTTELPLAKQKRSFMVEKVDDTDKRKCEVSNEAVGEEDHRGVGARNNDINKTPSSVTIQKDSFQDEEVERLQTPSGFQRRCHIAFDRKVETIRCKIEEFNNGSFGKNMKLSFFNWETEENSFESLREAVGLVRELQMCQCKGEAERVDKLTERAIYEAHGFRQLTDTFDALPAGTVIDLRIPRTTNESATGRILDFYSLFMELFTSVGVTPHLLNKPRLPTDTLHLSNPFYRHSVRRLNCNDRQISDGLFRDCLSIKVFVLKCIDKFFQIIDWFWMSKDRNAHLSTLHLMLLLFEYGLWTREEVNSLMHKLHFCCERLRNYETKIQEWLETIRLTDSGADNETNDCLFLINQVGECRVAIAKIIHQTIAFVHDDEVLKVFESEIAQNGEKGVEEVMGKVVKQLNERRLFSFEHFDIDKFNSYTSFMLLNYLMKPSCFKSRPALMAHPDHATIQAKLDTQIAGVLACLSDVKNDLVMKAIGNMQPLQMQFYMGRLESNRWHQFADYCSWLLSGVSERETQNNKLGFTTPSLANTVSNLSGLIDCVTMTVVKDCSNQNEYASFQIAFCLRRFSQRLIRLFAKLLLNPMLGKQNGDALSESVVDLLVLLNRDSTECMSSVLDESTTEYLEFVEVERPLFVDLLMVRLLATDAGVAMHQSIDSVREKVRRSFERCFHRPSDSESPTDRVVATKRLFMMSKLMMSLINMNDSFDFKLHCDINQVVLQNLDFVRSMQSREGFVVQPVFEVPESCPTAPNPSKRLYYDQMYSREERLLVSFFDESTSTETPGVIESLENLAFVNYLKLVRVNWNTFVCKEVREGVAELFSWEETMKQLGKLTAYHSEQRQVRGPGCAEVSEYVSTEFVVTFVQLFSIFHLFPENSCLVPSALCSPVELCFNRKNIDKAVVRGDRVDLRDFYDQLLRLFSACNTFIACLDCATSVHQSSPANRTQELYLRCLHPVIFKLCSGTLEHFSSEEYQRLEAPTKTTLISQVRQMETLLGVPLAEDSESKDRTKSTQTKQVLLCLSHVEAREADLQIEDLDLARDGVWQGLFSDSEHRKKFKHNAAQKSSLAQLRQFFEDCLKRTKANFKQRANAEEADEFVTNLFVVLTRVAHCYVFALDLFEEIKPYRVFCKGTLSAETEAVMHERLSNHAKYFDQEQTLNRMSKDMRYSDFERALDGDTRAQSEGSVVTHPLLPFPAFRPTAIRFIKSRKENVDSFNDFTFNVSCKLPEPSDAMLANYGPRSRLQAVVRFVAASYLVYKLRVQKTLKKESLLRVFRINNSHDTYVDNFIGYFASQLMSLPLSNASTAMEDFFIEDRTFTLLLFTFNLVYSLSEYKQALFRHCTKDRAGSELFVKLWRMRLCVFELLSKKVFKDKGWQLLNPSFYLLSTFLQFLCEDNFFPFKRLIHETKLPKSEFDKSGKEVCLLKLYNSKILQAIKSSELFLENKAGLDDFDRGHNSAIYVRAISEIKESFSGGEIHPMEIYNQRADVWIGILYRSEPDLSSDFYSIELAVVEYLRALTDCGNKVILQFMANKVLVKKLYGECVRILRLLFIQSVNQEQRSAELTKEERMAAKRVQNELIANGRLLDFDKMTWFYKSETQFANCIGVDIVVSIFSFMQSLKEHDLRYRDFFEMMDRATTTDGEAGATGSSKDRLLPDEVVTWRFIQTIVMTIELKVTKTVTGESSKEDGLAEAATQEELRDRDLTEAREEKSELVSYTFKKYPLCLFQKPDMKKAFYESAPFGDIDQKHESFFKFVDFAIEEMKGHQRAFSFSPLFERYYSPFAIKAYLLFMYVVVIAINVISLVFYNAETDDFHSTRYGDASVAVTLLALTDAGVALVLLAVWVVLKLPTAIKIERLKFRNENGKKSKMRLHHKLYHYLFCAVLTNGSFVTFSAYLVLSLMGFYSKFFYTIMLFLIVEFSQVIRGILVVVVSNAVRLFWSLIIMLIVVNFFAFVITESIGAHMGGDYSGVCDNYFQCFVNSIRVGLMSDSGVMAMLQWSVEVGSPFYFSIYVIALTSFLLVNLLLLAMFFGIIVDGFTDYVTDLTNRAKDQEDACFLCDLNKGQIERYGQLFPDHKDYHDIFQYISYIIYLRSTPIDDFTSIDYQILMVLKGKNKSAFLPYKQCLTINNGKEEEESSK